MKDFLIIFIVVCLCGTATAGKLIITSLPDTIYTADHTALYNAGTHTVDTVFLVDSVDAGGFLLSTDKHAIIVASSSDNYYFEFYDDTVLFGTDSSCFQAGYVSGYDRPYGFQLGQNNDNITIHNGTFLCIWDGFDTLTPYYASWHKPDYWGESNSLLNRVITARNLHNNFVLDNVNIEYWGFGGIGVYLKYGINDTIVNCSLVNNVNSFYSRMAFQETGISLNSRMFSGGDTACVLLDNSIIGGHIGIFLSNGLIDQASNPLFNDSLPVFIVDGCNVSMDAWAANLDSLRILSAYPGAGTTQGYDIYTYHIHPWSEIKNCSLTVGSSHAGGRAIALYGAGGNYNSGTGQINITNNYCRTHEGPSWEYQIYQVMPAVIKSRRSRNVDIHDNVFVIKGTANDTPIVKTSWHGQVSSMPRGVIFSYDVEYDPIPYDTSRVPYNFEFRNNRCSVITDSNPTNYWDMGCYTFGGGDQLTTWDSTIKFDSNFFYNEGNFYAQYTHGTFTSEPNFIKIRWDSIETANPASMDSVTTWSINEADHTPGSQGHVALDMRFTSAGQDTLHGLYHWAYTFTNLPGDTNDTIESVLWSTTGVKDSNEISIERTLTLVAVDLQNDAIQGADIWAVDGNGNTQDSAVSNIFGTVQLQVPIWYIGNAPPDTSYNDYKIYYHYAGEYDSTLNFTVGYLPAQAIDTGVLGADLAPPSGSRVRWHK